jgi:succinylglutamic semialdehyde dehydrogenase
LSSFDPCTDELVWSGPVSSMDEIGAAITTARTAFSAWSQTALEERIAVARAFAALVKARKPELARLISRETGKPFWETQTEIDSVAGKVEISITAQAERTGVRDVAAGAVHQVLRHKPHGVLAVLGPYNFPMHLANGHIVPALLAGNTVLFKPSDLTPACGHAIAALWHEASLPEGVLQVLTGGAAVGQALAASDAVDGILFTGGVQAGLALHRALAGQPHRMLALELGGNNPLIVWDVADVEAAAQLIVQSAYLSAGQRCTCARRLIVPAGAAGEPFIEATAALISRLRIGPPFEEPQPFLGPVISNAAAERLEQGQVRMTQLGAHAIVVMERLVANRPFLTPGLIDVTTQAERDDSELFGPLLQVVRVASFDAAIAEANATRFGLAAGLVSDDRALYDRLWAQARAGIVNWNRPLTGASSAAPFGGIGLSGNHRPSAYYAADYVAYPVAGLEEPGQTATITTGLM